MQLYTLRALSGCVPFDFLISQSDQLISPSNANEELSAAGHERSDTENHSFNL